VVLLLRPLRALAVIRLARLLRPKLLREARCHERREVGAAVWAAHGAARLRRDGLGLNAGRAEGVAARRGQRVLRSAEAVGAGLHRLRSN
tara:strand:- start:76 stop:345 length:270 start_codon:yes stop_codon:yes gene_type:complete